MVRVRYPGRLTARMHSVLEICLAVLVWFGLAVRFLILKRRCDERHEAERRKFQSQFEARVWRQTMEYVVAGELPPAVQKALSTWILAEYPGNLEAFLNSK